MSQLDLLDHDLGPMERLNVSLVRKAHASPVVGAALRFCQRNIAVRCVNSATRRILEVSGAERIPAIDPAASCILVCNHQSFIDLLVAASWLTHHKHLRHRLLFPVRSELFYTSPLGLAVNGAMGFFAMYPPIFRDPHRVALNLAALDEVVHALHARPTLLGLHPEAARNIGGTPYQLLPPQTGVGRIIFQARVPVIPVFVHGFTDHLATQVIDGFRGTAPPVFAVFGAPLSLDALWRCAPGPTVYRHIAHHAATSIAALGVEERARREAQGLPLHPPAPLSAPIQPEA
jgi:1-acyl-sn-glycerol-3-phosphate acyltransferase